MRGYLLDTNVMIALINGRPPQVRKRFQQEVEVGVPMFLSSVVEFELYYGVHKSSQFDKNLEKLQTLLSHPFQAVGLASREAMVSGKIRSDLELKGTPIGAYDFQIAGQALCHGLTLVTANAGEFTRVPGLTVVDWSQPESAGI